MIVIDINIYATMQQCLGRLVLKRDLYFESGPRLHRNKPLLFLIPIRCENTSSGELCDICVVKRDSTMRTLEKHAGKYIPNQGTLLHGCVTEEIPEWSRLYMGPWWQKQIDDGYIMSYETVKSAENAYKNTYKDIELKLDSLIMAPRKTAVNTEEAVKKPVRSRKKVVETPVVTPVETPVVIPVETPVVIPVETVETPVKKLVRSKKKAVVPAPVEVVPAPVKKMKKKEVKSKTAEIVVQPILEEPVTEPVKEPVKKVKKFIPKKAEPTLKVISQTPIEPDEEVVIELRQIEINRSKVLYNSKNDKVYDLKFNYIGRRLRDEIDRSFPDSDGE